MSKRKFSKRTSYIEPRTLLMSDSYSIMTHPKKHSERRKTLTISSDHLAKSSSTSLRYLKNEKSDKQFLMQINEENDSLKKEYDTLKQTHSETLTQIANLKRMRELDNITYLSKMKLLISKIHELCTLIDINKLPNEYITTVPNSNKKQVKDIDMLFEELVPNNDINNPYETSLVLNNNNNETTIHHHHYYYSNGNQIKLKLIECKFNHNEDKEQINININMNNKEMLFVIKCLSQLQRKKMLVKDKDNNVNYVSQFNIEEDENILKELQKGFITIEMFSITNDNKTLLGLGKIPLTELIISEYPYIKGTCIINNSKDQNKKIADISYSISFRYPLSSVLKWYQHQCKFIKEQISNVEKPLNTVELPKSNRKKAFQITIQIVKATNLESPIGQKDIKPYFYYHFYHNNERYSQTSNGNNPVFRDIAVYTVIHNKQLIDYLEKETLNVYFFDSSRPLELDEYNANQVKVTDEAHEQDFIGVCRIPLKELITNGNIGGTFPIQLSRYYKKKGEMEVYIFWEELFKNTYDDKELQLKTLKKQKDISNNVETLEKNNYLLLLANRCMRYNDIIYFYNESLKPRKEFPYSIKDIQLLDNLSYHYMSSLLNSLKIVHETYISNIKKQQNDNNKLTEYIIEYKHVILDELKKKATYVINTVEELFVNKEESTDETMKVDVNIMCLKIKGDCYSYIAEYSDNSNNKEQQVDNAWNCYNEALIVAKKVNEVNPVVLQLKFSIAMFYYKVKRSLDSALEMVTKTVDVVNKEISDKKDLGGNDYERKKWVNKLLLLENELKVKKEEMLKRY